MPFARWRKFQAGIGKGRASFLGVLSQLLTQVAVGSGSAETLHSHTIPASTLYKNGMFLRVVAWGSFAGDADAGTVVLKFGGSGGTVIATATKTNAGLWRLEALVFRTGAATQKSHGQGQVSNTAQDTLTNAAPSQTLAANVAVIVEGDATNANDVVCEGSFVEVHATA